MLRVQEVTREVCKVAYFASIDLHQGSEGSSADIVPDVDGQLRASVLSAGGASTWTSLKHACLCEGACLCHSHRPLLQLLRHMRRQA